MILKASKDPVLVKKISLRVWKLKDEINFRVKQIVDNTPEGEEPDYASIEQEYSSAMELAEVININGENSDSKEENSAEEKSNNDREIVQIIPDLDDELISNAKAMLSEIYMDRIFLFSGHKYLVGQSIVIEFLIPKKFVINAEIKFCKQFNHKSRIISSTRPVFRLAADFTFIKKGERTVLRQFIESIKEESIKEEAPKPKSDDDDDDLDELDGL